MSHRDHLQQLIINSNRRLQKLKEQKALMGLETPSHILIEIDDIQAEIVKLEEQLAALAEPYFVNEAFYPMSVQQTQPYPQPASQIPTQRAIFVGRQTHLKELEHHWKEALYQQRGKVIFLTGEAGIGKTSLVQQFSQMVLADYPNVQYLSAMCDQIAGDIAPYAPFIQLLNSLTEQATQQNQHWIFDFVQEIGPDILNMVPVTGPFLAAVAKSANSVWQQRRRNNLEYDSRGRFGQQDIFQQFTNMFKSIARNKNPLLLFIDDWHWADTSSTDLLFHLARQLNDVPILFLATYRPHDARRRKHPIRSVRAEVERYKIGVRLSLDFLSKEEIATYLTCRFPNGNFAPVFVNWLYDITNGNALFTTEYVNLLLKEGLLTPKGYLVSDLNQVLRPANVEAVIRSRIDYLDQDACYMLAYGSVEGEEFTTLLLSQLLKVDSLSLLKCLREIEQTHQLIISQGQRMVYGEQTTVYRFVHTLVHHTLYSMLEDEERVEINKALLELRGRIYNQADAATKASLIPELIAHAAEARDHLIEARYALAAAEDASKRYAHAEVLKHGTIGLQALDKLPQSLAESDELRLKLLMCRGRTQDHTNAWPQSLETYRQVESLINRNNLRSELIPLLNRIGWVLRHLGDYDQAKAYYDQCIALSEQKQNRSEVARAKHGLGDVYWRQSKYDQALKWYKEALSLRQMLNDKSSMAQSSSAIAKVYENLGDYNKALQWGYRSKALNEEADDKNGLGWNYQNIGFILVKRGDNEQALVFFQEALKIWKEFNFQRGQAAAAAGIGDVYRNLGDYEQALIWYHNSMYINQTIEYKHGLGWNYNSIGLIYQSRHSYTEALELYQKALAIWQDFNFKRDEAITLHNIGLIFEEQSKYREAWDYYQKALAIREQIGNPKRITETRERLTALQVKVEISGSSIQE